MHSVQCGYRVHSLTVAQKYLNRTLNKIVFFCIFFFLIQREAIRRGLDILQYEVPGGDTFMHEGFKRVYITVPSFFDLYVLTLL